MSAGAKNWKWREGVCSVSALRAATELMHVVQAWCVAGQWKSSCVRSLGSGVCAVEESRKADVVGPIVSGWSM